MIDYDAILAEIAPEEEKDEAQRKLRLDRAVQWLDDGNWHVEHPFQWKRGCEDYILTYYIDSDRVHLRNPLNKKDKGFDTKAFRRLFTMRYLTEGGYGENTLEKLLKRKLPTPTLPKEFSLAPTILTAEEKKWNDNIPPSRETLQNMVGWDNHLQLLFKYNEDRQKTELVLGNFVELGGETYAVWRVLSMYFFGNATGKHTVAEWRAALAMHPVMAKPLIPETPPQKVKKRYKVSTTPPKPVPIDRDAPEKEQRFDSMVAAGRLEKQLIHESKKAEQARKLLARRARSKAKVAKPKQVEAAPKKPDQQELALQRILDKRKLAEQAERIRGFKLRAKERLAAERKADHYE